MYNLKNVYKNKISLNCVIFKLILISELQFTSLNHLKVILKQTRKH